MLKKFFIFLILILLTLSGFLFFNLKESERVKAQTAPIATLKTKVDGNFYVPVLNPQSLEVVYLFDNPGLEGDQTGASGEPDGKVDMRDVGFVNSLFGKKEGDPGWKYLADVVADRKIDMRDIGLVSNNFGKSGTYINDLTGVSILFDNGDEFNLDAGGKCNIPAGATGFTVKKNGVPIGAYINFYTEVVPPCICNAWVNDACGPAGSCPIGQMHQTRTCNPAGCDIETQCVVDPACCACGAWTNDSCGVAGCSANEMHQTRTCNPAGCDIETQCVVDPSCIPPSETCAQLGGTCCSGGQVCTAGKITGASDCLECCSDVVDCKVVGVFLKLTNPLACATFSECIEKIISFVLWVATAIVPIMIIVAGFLFLTSGGDPEKVRTAKRIIFWTVIGLAIILLAKGVISVIKQIIGG